MKEIEAAIGIAATKIAEDVNANCIVSVESFLKSEFEDSSDLKVKVHVFKKVKQGVYSKEEYNTSIRKSKTGSISHIKELLMDVANKKLLKRGERVVFVGGEPVGAGYKGMLFVFDVDNVFFDISKHNLAENINSDIIEAVINIATEISREGREGKNIGTAFVLGDKEDIKKYTKQLIINPFENSARNITDPAVKETLKEFSQLDGIFVINSDGTIISAGTYLDIDTGDGDFGGYGTRHRCCSALTQRVPNALSVVISKSGGIITVFKNGQVVMKLP